MEKTVKKRATITALALLTAASVGTSCLFDTPEALLAENDSPAVVYQVSTGPDGADDDDAGLGEGESEETRRRGGVRSVLRARILRLPLFVRLLVILPLWAAGSAILAAAGAAWTLLQPMMGKLAGFALMLALLLLCFGAAAKAAFPDLPLKKLFSRRSLVGVILGAAGLTATDAVLGASWAEYEQMKNLVLSVGFFLALSCVSVPFLLREQKKRLREAAERRERKPDKPAMLTFTDAAGTFRVKVPNVGK